MMYSQNAAARYRAVLSHGLVADASPTRLVQIMFEHAMSQLAVAAGCMARIEDNHPLNQVIAKGAAVSKAVRLISHLDASLDMERGGQIAANLRALYHYMLNRLTQANVTNDPRIVAEVSALLGKIKSSWDQIVKDGR